MTSADDELPGIGSVEPVQYAADLVLLTGRSADPARSLCALAVTTLGMAGAGVVLARSDALECVAVFDERSDRIETIEYTIGEGPCVSAFRSSMPAADPDLGAASSVHWPAFRREAAHAGIRAAFGFPLLSAGSCFGALNLYRDAPGSLTNEQYADALVVAEVSARVLLDWQAAAKPGQLAWQLDRGPENRVQVHQAVGRVSVQADVSVTDAYALLRAYAFSHDRSIIEIAVDVATGILRIE